MGGLTSGVSVHNFVDTVSITMSSNQTGLEHAWLPGDKTIQSIRKDLAS